ncbi:hypothetical protein ACNI0V_24105, partial [Escherichia coli]
EKRVFLVILFTSFSGSLVSRIPGAVHWKGPAISYIGRDELEACGEAFLAQVRQQAEKLVREMVA